MRALGLLAGEREQVDADDRCRRCVKRAVAVLDVAGRRLERLARRASCACSTVRSDATRTAEPPTKSEREPALPKPLPRSVSPWTMRILLDRHAEHVDRELRVAGREALAHRLRRREDLDDAVGRDVDA